MEVFTKSFYCCCVSYQQVDEGARESLNTAHIRATDVDTFVSDLSIIISVPPSFGFLENIGPGKIDIFLSSY